MLVLLFTNYIHQPQPELQTTLSSQKFLMLQVHHQVLTHSKVLQLLELEGLRGYPQPKGFMTDPSNRWGFYGIPPAPEGFMGDPQPICYRML